MYFLLAVLLLMISTSVYYLLAKKLREVVEYSKSKNLKIANEVARSELILIANPKFMLALLRNSLPSQADDLQNQLLLEARKKYIQSLLWGLLAALAVLAHVLSTR